MKACELRRIGVVLIASGPSSSRVAPSAPTPPAARLARAISSRTPGSAGRKPGGKRARPAAPERYAGLGPRQRRRGGRHRPARALCEGRGAVDRAELTEQERGARQQARLVGRHRRGGFGQHARVGAGAGAARARRPPERAGRDNRRWQPAIRRARGQRRHGGGHAERDLGLLQQQRHAQVLGRLREHVLQRRARGLGVAPMISTSAQATRATVNPGARVVAASTRAPRPRNRPRAPERDRARTTDGAARWPRPRLRRPCAPPPRGPRRAADRAPAPRPQSPRQGRRARSSRPAPGRQQSRARSRARSPRRAPRWHTPSARRRRDRAGWTGRGGAPPPGRGRGR